MRFAARMGASDFVDCVSARMGANIVFILLCVFFMLFCFQRSQKTVQAIRTTSLYFFKLRFLETEKRE